MTDQARRTTRYAINQGLALRCDNWNEFVQYYATDISQGGLFIVTDSVLQIMSVVEVRLDLPEGHQIPLKARVVHVLDKATAEAEGKRPGVGVEFIDMDSAHKHHIQQLVDFARWEGTAGTNTYASHMFERAASHQTLDEVVLSLPPVKQTSGAPRVRASSPAAEPGDSTPRRKRKRKQRAGKSSRETGEYVKAGHEADKDHEDAAVGAPSTPKPSDPLKLKEAMTHFAHRRYAEAVADFQKMDEDNPGDVEANKWMCIARARIAIANDSPDAAVAHYESALKLDEDNHEARRFVRDHHRSRKLDAIPFGRLFRRNTE